MKEFLILTLLSTGLTAQSTTVAWNWSPESGFTPATGFEVYRAIGSSCAAVTPYESIPSLTDTYIDNAVIAGDTYTYAVAATDSVGPSVLTPCVTVSPSNSQLPLRGRPPAWPGLSRRL